MQFETDTDDISIFSHLVDWDIWLVFITNKTFLQVLFAQKQVDERNNDHQQRASLSFVSYLLNESKWLYLLYHI